MEEASYCRERCCLLGQPTENSKFGSSRHRAEAPVSGRTDIFDPIRGNRTSKIASISAM